MIEGKSGAGRDIGIGMLGYGMMGRAHSAALKRLSQFFGPLQREPRLVATAARSEEKVADLASRFGYTSWYRNWEELVADPEVEIFDNTGPNHLHAEPCIAAARAGKHLICEKPLARSAAEAKRMLEAAQAAGVKHLCGFNYRFLPAVRLARLMIEEGRIGKPVHFRARYLNPSMADPSTPYRWRLDREMAGMGVLGDLGSHIIDLARFLVGEPAEISGSTNIFVAERPMEGDPSRKGRVTTDDAFQAMVRFEGGATGLLEASRMCLGSQNRLEFELNGTEGSLQFCLEQMNDLRVYLKKDEDSNLPGFRQVIVTGMDHPFLPEMVAQASPGVDHTFVHEMAHFLEAVAGEHEVAPYGATFEDGYRAAVICDAILASAESGSWVKIEY